MDLELAGRYFQEMKAISDKDGGKLWGHSLYGPLLFVDRKSRRIVSNQADLEGNLSRQGNVYTGNLPKDIHIANTAIEWAGVRWTMVIWPLHADPRRRARLVVHESFHRIQDEIGFPAESPPSRHLDTVGGRIWLQLEWRALGKALGETDRKRVQAVRDALIFRRYRRSLFEEAETEENALEMNEGLAEYTGVRLGGLSEKERIEFAAKKLAVNEGKDSLIRSFAYVSGPAYGLLLDQTGENWRDQLKTTRDLGALLQSALDISLPEMLEAGAMSRAADYEGQALSEAENQRAEEHEKRLLAYRTRLVDGPVLLLPLKNWSWQFDPNNLVSLGDIGTVYPTMRVKDSWGILEVTDGALLSFDRTRLFVEAPEKIAEGPLEGAGWTLDLNEGWSIKPGEREGDSVLVESRQTSNEIRRK